MPAAKSPTKARARVSLAFTEPRADQYLVFSATSDITCAFGYLGSNGLTPSRSLLLLQITRAVTVATISLPGTPSSLPPINNTCGGGGGPTTSPFTNHDLRIEGTT